MVAPTGLCVIYRFPCHPERSDDEALLCKKEASKMRIQNKNVPKNSKKRTLLFCAFVI